MIVGRGVARTSKIALAAGLPPNALHRLLGKTKLESTPPTSAYI